MQNILTEIESRIASLAKSAEYANTRVSHKAASSASVGIWRILNGTVIAVEESP